MLVMLHLHAFPVLQVILSTPIMHRAMSGGLIPEAAEGDVAGCSGGSSDRTKALSCPY